MLVQEEDRMSGTAQTVKCYLFLFLNIVTLYTTKNIFQNDNFFIVRVIT